MVFPSGSLNQAERPMPDDVTTWSIVLTDSGSYSSNTTLANRVLLSPADTTHLATRLERTRSVRRGAAPPTDVGARNGEQRNEHCGCRDRDGIGGRSRAPTATHWIALQLAEPRRRPLREVTGLGR